MLRGSSGQSHIDYIDQSTLGHMTFMAGSSSHFNDCVKFNSNVLASTLIGHSSSISVTLRCSSKRCLPWCSYNGDGVKNIEVTMEEMKNALVRY